MRGAIFAGLVFFLFLGQSYGQNCASPYVVDWDDYPLGTDPRNQTYSVSDVEFSISSIDIYGHVSGFEVSNSLQGIRSIVWEQTIDNRNEYAIATFKFSKPTYSFNFTIFDVDQGVFQDSLTINGYSDGKLVTLVGADVTTSAANTFIGNNTVLGTGFADNNSADGNVTITVPETIDSLVFLYNNYTPATFQTIGIHDFYWCGADNDYDHVLNVDDADDDNDGIPDITEAGGVDPGADEDGDDIPDYMDSDFSAFVDVNADGIHDGYDADLDGIPNHLDRDSDNDGIPDAVEANGGVLPDNMSDDGRYEVTYAMANDTDADGIVNDLDTDNGGAPLANNDTDGDGIPDMLDADSDGDGIPDSIEAGAVDADGDGRADDFFDADNDGINDNYDLTNNGDVLLIADTDADGLPDYRDIDSDRDGIPDNVEAQSSLGYRAESGLDSDGDGIDDAYDVDGSGAIVLQDTDGDGKYDFIDGDSDGDGLRDIFEANDANSDGQFNLFNHNTDTDGDGLANMFDADNGGSPAPLQNTDGDALPDWRDNDDDNDGILTANEDFNLDFNYANDFTQGGNPTPDYLFYTDDMDGDGVSADADIDDNNDGIADVDQGYGVDPGADADGDGTPNYLDSDFVHPTKGAFVDANADGINDIFDIDQDGIPNHLDLDADNDGIPNAVEANSGVLPANMTEDGQFTSSYASANDSDADGLVDDVDPSTGGTALTTDTDGDGVEDYLDADSDGDGILDSDEAGAYDSNNNGINDSYSNIDGDALPDYLDADSDGDGITDNVEGQATVSYSAPTGIDTDGDGLDNAYDTDNGGVAFSPYDADADGTADFRDTDSDNDGVADSIEGHDANSNGTADRTASGTDTDGDGLDNAFDPDNGGVAASVQNTDGSGEPDFRDNDDDDDNILTENEAVDNDPANGIADYLEATTNPCGGGYVQRNITGNASSVVFNNGVTSANNSLGAANFDGTTGTVSTFQNGDYMYLDLQEYVPAGETIEIYMVTSSGDGMLVATSNEINNGYINLSGNTTFTDNAGGNQWTIYYYTVPAEGARYMLFQRTAGTVYLDAVGYNFNKCIDDKDADGVADDIDNDDDNDGIADADELPATYGSDPDADDDYDGIPNFRDSDFAGFTDSNYDGVDDQTDYDQDGVPNHLDLDSDNDGLVDALEANGGTLPANMTGQGNYTATYVKNNDSDNDGFANAVDNTPLPNPDSDSDGLRDIYDRDSDNDGITDLVEAGGTDVDGNGILDNFSDSDGDGLGNSVDQNNSDLALSVPDTDSDGTPDYLDTDSDGDGIRDIIEAHDSNADGVADWDDNGNTFLDAAEGFADADGDGILDAFDRNSGGRIASLTDVDNDGVYNFQDNDDDDDGTPTADEDSNGNNIWSDDFSAGQTGTPDYLYNALTALPVELLSFEGVFKEDYIQLTWVTASEVNNEGFEVERSVDGRNFEMIGFVHGNGTTKDVHSYNYNDKGFGTAPIYYYRLRQLDYDGQHEYSRVIAVYLEGVQAQQPVAVSAFPNPCTDYINVKFSNYDEAFEYEIINYAGDVIAAGVMNDTMDARLNVSQLKEGIYILKINGYNFEKALRIVKR
ncbi:T9SS type A sorting domain-containing protein [Fulvivirga maritima]|uniref:T9SS type A sorting domain-containing protein n=1 Tax=Fulvivirga maritima TaxID=2904247 RepID=UPI001F3EBE82|nr:T9SS type A sorting domain-containing protein [Fulvivirga maritima]UII24691.1 T9SS type A sorting domain-containing protein [Fulvivirga maritima]